MRFTAEDAEIAEIPPGYAVNYWCSFVSIRGFNSLECPEFGDFGRRKSAVVGIRRNYHPVVGVAALERGTIVGQARSGRGIPGRPDVADAIGVRVAEQLREELPEIDGVLRRAGDCCPAEHGGALHHLRLLR